MERNLFTIGYEGYSINDFLYWLIKHNIKYVLDVRELPLSRKKGFSKKVFAQHLSQEKIHYYHMKELGTPKDLREKLKRDQDYTYFFRAVNRHLEENTIHLKTVQHLVEENKCCLMCFEHEADKCHRSLIAQKIVESSDKGLQIVNI